LTGADAGFAGVGSRRSADRPRSSWLRRSRRRTSGG